MPMEPTKYLQTVVKDMFWPYFNYFAFVAKQKQNSSA